MSHFMYKIGIPQTFTVEVTPARNVPIDVYLLMDLSFSMRDDLANIQRLGPQIGKVFHFGKANNWLLASYAMSSLLDYSLCSYHHQRPVHRLQNWIWIICG